MNISAGLGFSGYDEHGEAQFDLLENADAVKVEVGFVFNRNFVVCCVLNNIAWFFISVLALSMLSRLIDRRQPV